MKPMSTKRAAIERQKTIAYAEIIEQRYERSRRYGQLTHFIANATPNELEGSFTPMVFDRLRSMCTSIHFTGTSKR